MLYSLTGKVVHTDVGGVAVQCGGIAFYCAASQNTLRHAASVGAEVTLYTYLSVREDAMDLYGFSDPQEMSCFKLLIGVTGVGPKAAQRIVLELGDKVSGDAISKGFGSFGAPAAPTMKGNAGEAIAALVSLGYSNSEAAAAVGKLPQEDSVEDMIKKALRALAMGR